MVAATLFLEQKEFPRAKEEYLKLIAILKQLIDIAAAVEKAQLEELLDSAKQSLSAHQLYTLLWNGDPAQTNTAPVWRPLSGGG